MEYYTSYTLGGVGHFNGRDHLYLSPELEKQFCAAFVEVCGEYYGCGNEAIETTQDIEETISSDVHKWYDHEEQLREVSARVPNVLIHLHGEGESNGDLWDKYFLNGKVQVCEAEIFIPPFDPSKMV